MKKKILKSNGFRKVLAEKSIDTFISKTFENDTIYLDIKESGNCIIHGNLYIIGWTDDVHFAFDIWNNSVPISTFDELYQNRK